MSFNKLLKLNKAGTVKKITLIVILGIIMLFLLFSQTTFGKRLFFESGVLDYLKKLFNHNQQFLACDYKEGTIILIKPVATGVGEGRYEAGDIVEIRDPGEICKNIGNVDFLGKEEKTKLLPLYYPKKLTEEQKRELMEPEYEENYQIPNSNFQLNSNDQKEEKEKEPERKMVMRRQYGIDYTKFLSNREILKVRNLEGLNKIPEIDLSTIIKKENGLSFLENESLKNKKPANLADSSETASKFGIFGLSPNFSIADYKTVKNYSSLFQQKTSLIPNLAMLNVSNFDNVGLGEDEFNSVVANSQPVFFKLPSSQLFNFRMLKWMIESAELSDLFNNLTMNFERQPMKFFFSNRMEKIFKHKENNYLFSFLSRALNRLSTSLPGIQDFSLSASATLSSVSRTASGLDNSIKSMMSSNNSLESTLAGASTPRKFLSLMMVNGNDFAIQNNDNKKENNLSIENCDIAWPVASERSEDCYRENSLKTPNQNEFGTGQVENCKLKIKSVVQLPPYLEKIEKTQKFFKKLVSFIIPQAKAGSGTKTICPSGQGCDYTTLNAWEAGEQADLTNNGPAIAQIQGDWSVATDTTGVIIDGWTTTQNDYIKIYTTPEARHNGKWDETKYRLVVPRAEYYKMVNIYEDFVIIEGLQFKISTNNTAAGVAIISIDGSSVAAETGIYIRDNILTQGTLYDPNNDVVHGIVYGQFNYYAKAYIYNNIIYGLKSRGILQDGPNRTWYIYNNTIYGCGAGIVKGAGGTAIAKNNLSYNNTDNYFSFSYGFSASSTNNLSGPTQTDAPGSNPRNGVTVTFADEANYDFHLAYTDTGAKGYGTNLSADPYIAFSDDIDGQTRQGSWDIGADQYQAKPIYRSVGPSNTSPLASSTGQTLTINNDTATFSQGLPDNIGVGDVIVYNSSGTTTQNTIAFIHQRISSTQYIVKDKYGNTPLSTSNSTNWQIYRAYTSLVNAEAGIENTGIPANLRNFDTWSGGKNLASSTEQWNIACYGDATDTAGVTIDGWTTTESNYIRIYTPYLPTEVGTSQRHNGKWDETKYRLRTSDRIIDINISFVKLDGLQLDNINKNNQGIVDYSQGYLSNSIIKNASHGIYVGDKFYAFNNIIYDCDIGFYSPTGQKYFYNNTVYNCSAYGFKNTGGHIHAKNNISYNNVDNYDGSFSSDSTNNLSGPNSDPDTPGSNPRNGVTVTFADEANYDFHLAYTDTGAKGYGASLSADPYIAFSDDIDGQTRQGSWDIGADQYQAKPIYRSVGPSNTSPLASSTGQTLTINNDTATFSQGLPDNIGVGDVIVYNSSGTTTQNTIAFIHQRISSTQYIVKDKYGNTPLSTSNSTNWQIYRAYTSLANAEAGIENTGIPANLRDFDTWSGGKNLASSTEQWNIACYGDATDTAAVTIDGWTTTADNYIKIYTPYLPTEVGVSQRHNGKWDETKYRLAAGANALTNYEDFVKLDGLQIKNTQTSWADGPIRLEVGNNGAKITISNCILTTNGGVYPVGIFVVTGTVTASIYAYNNIIYGFTGGSGWGYGIYMSWFNSVLYAYNNTIYNNVVGIYRNTGSIIAKNNISYNNTDNYYGDFDSSSTNNLSGPNSDPDTPGSNPRNGVTVTFADEANKDFHLAYTDTGAKGYGANLSADSNLAFSNDIDGEGRPRPGISSWDIGADQYNGGESMKIRGQIKIKGEATIR